MAAASGASMLTIARSSMLVYFDLSPAEHDAVKAVHFLTKLIDTSAEHLFAVLEHE
jgi:hypothetical protein